MSMAAIRVCQNCKQEFTIYPEDLEFYGHMKIPLPTFCPECRLKRRYAYRNQMNLYRRTCDLCKRDVVSMYSKDKSFPVYCQTCFHSDAWDPSAYGKEYDFSKSFFEQFKELQKITPRICLTNINGINSEYCNYASNNKDCYLSFSIGASEGCLYVGPQITKTRNSIACSMSINNELCYECLDCSDCYELVMSQNCKNCLSSLLLFDCRNVRNSIGCINLRNREFCILNEQYSKEGFEKKKLELNLGSYQVLEVFIENFKKLKKSTPHRFATIENSINCTGDNIVSSKNCLNSFAVNNSENCRYVLIGNSAKDSYDINNCYPSTELCYEVMSPVESSRCKYAVSPWGGSADCEYVDTCIGVRNCFGCISMKKAEYSILNKKYNKESYEKLKSQIIDHMNTKPYTGKDSCVYGYGEFFPIEVSVFSYNESVAFEYYPQTKEEVIKKGYEWKESEDNNYKPDLVTQEIPDQIKDVSDELSSKVIECEHKKNCSHICTGVFRILPKELAFYKKYNIPIPRLCIKCRTLERMKLRNPIKVWQRRCGCSLNNAYKNQVEHHHGSTPCSNNFETAYSEDRTEIVYCESCYQSEVL